MEPLRIGLDFDGVFSDCDRLKNDVATVFYDMPYQELDDDRKRAVRNAAYGNQQFVRKMEPLPDAFKYVTKLHQDGYDIRVITSRDGEFLNLAKDWFSRQRDEQPYDVPDLAFTGVGYPGSKAPACRDHQVDVFVDDDLHKLEPLHGHVSHLFHFSLYETETDPTIAEPVQHWEELYDNITALTD